MGRPSPDPESAAIGVSAVLVAVVLFSAGSTSIKWSQTPGPVIGFWRLFFAALIWQVIVWRNGHRWDRTSLRATSGVGLLFGANLLCFFTGVTQTRIAHAEFIGALGPVVVVPIAAVVLRERVPRLFLGAGSIAFLGVGLIIFGGSSKGESTLRGDLLCAAGVLLWAGYLLVSKGVRSTVSASVFMAGMTSIAAVAVFPIASRSGLTDLSARAWIVIAFSTVVNGVVGHFLIAWSQRRVAVGIISLLTLGQPGLGTLWGWAALGETVEPAQLAGMAILLAAVGTIAVHSTRATRAPVRSVATAEAGSGG